MFDVKAFGGRPEVGASAKIIGAAFVVFFSAGVSSASGETLGARKAAAESLFQRGVELVAEGKIEEACRKFEASQELDSALGTMLHLGDCYERAGRTGSAWALFREARSLAGATGQSERERVATERVNALEPRLSYVVIDVAPQAGLVLRLNGTVIPRASFGAPLPVDPGEQRVEATAPGARSYRVRVLVPTGPSKVTFRVPRLEPARTKAREPVTAVAPAEDPAMARGRAQRVGGYVALGVGGAALAAGGVLAFLAKEKNDDAKSECGEQGEDACSAEGVHWRHQARGLASTATVTGIVGGVLAASGVALVLTAPNPSREVVLGPSVGTRSGGLEVRGSF
jgi:hypothetical protein